jgi:hypothetical protein
LEGVERPRLGEKRYRVEKTKMTRMNKDGRGSVTKKGVEGKRGKENLGGVKKKVYNRLKD